MLKSTVYTELEQEAATTLTPYRYQHSLGVVEMAVTLNRRYALGVDEQLLRSAAIAHDLAREWAKDELIAYTREHSLDVSDEEMAHPVLLHGPVEADLLRQRGLPSQLYVAVRHHSLGSTSMGMVGLVLYIADYMEPHRPFFSEGEREAMLTAPSAEELAIEVIERKWAFHREYHKRTVTQGERLHTYLKEGGRL
jgi:predicted HD superfamily hydrolase involved in NAD metabolism